MNEQSVIYKGQYDKSYTYWVHPIGTTFQNDEPGNYIFAKLIPSDGWRPVYIGQTSSLQHRLNNHEKEACARRNGATHIHVHKSSTSETERKAEESDLIAKFQPDCNEQMK